MKKALFCFLLLISISGFSQSESTLVTFENPTSVAKPKGYSHAAVVDLGNCKMVVLSGEVPFDKQGNLIGAGDMKKQAEQVFRNIQNILTDLGGTMDNVIKLGFYITDVSQIQAIRDATAQFINLKNPPTSILVEVNKLFRNDVLIEVEATAIIPKKVGQAN
ncbi:MAG: RidA family protein [Bacteroidetes bacterium]|nr:RidA family protein [Bacteroidota bacterium]